jgi:hypothetical protein
VLTLNPLGAKYLAVQLVDRWTRALDYAHRTSSLNSAQATANPDGSHTFVIAAAPGSGNWVDTAGLHDGVMFVRWQNLPPGFAPAAAVVSVELKPLSGLGTPAAAPSGFTGAARAADYARRFP